MSLSSLNQNFLSLVALVISVIALLTTVLQVLQQYFSSAEGYRRCSASVMGLWAKGTHRQLRMREFRVEVVFETPVIFVAPPTNMNGPIKGRPIHYIDGTPESYKTTRVLLPDEQKAEDQHARDRVHTADDERASWVTLLSTLQTKEHDSREWDKKRNLDSPPQTQIVKAPEYGLTVGLQSKIRSWDFMPSSLTKPYATTAICHLVEMMAMMGLYWKAFDLSLWNLRAEGNGHILTSTQIQGLGVMVTFAVTGKSVFKSQRLIPSEDIKDFCFGTVPDIFDAKGYLTEKRDAQNIDLVFGTNEEVSDTLESLGCSPKMIERYHKDHKHIFSVSFEIVAMLGKVVRIRGSNFRMLPNPTADPWLKNSDPRKASWRIRRLLDIFQERLQEYIDEKGFLPDHQIFRIADYWWIIQKHTCPKECPLDHDCHKDSELTIGAREAIHDAIDSIDEFLLGLKQSVVLGVLVSHLEKVMEILSEPTSQLNSIVLSNKEEPLINYYFKTIFPAVTNDVKSDSQELPTEQEKERRSEIWITLIFRMFCWLLLHDFDHRDVKIVPSALNRSRMPIFIG